MSFFFCCCEVDVCNGPAMADTFYVTSDTFTWTLSRLTSFQWESAWTLVAIAGVSDCADTATTDLAIRVRMECVDGAILMSYDVAMLICTGTGGFTNDLKCTNDTTPDEFASILGTTTDFDSTPETGSGTWGSVWQITLTDSQVICSPPLSGPWSLSP